MLLFAHCTGCGECDGPKKNITVEVRIPRADNGSCMDLRPEINGTGDVAKYSWHFYLTGKCADGSGMEIEADEKIVNFDPATRIATFDISVPIAIGKQWALEVYAGSPLLDHRCIYTEFIDEPWHPIHTTCLTERRVFKTNQVGTTVDSDLYDRYRAFSRFPLQLSFYQVRPGCKY